MFKAIGRILAAAGIVLWAMPASAVIVTGSYSGIITSGSATGSFGFAGKTDLTGLAISGTFSYDTARLTGCDGGQFWYRCGNAADNLTITQTVNGVTAIFGSALPPAGAPSYNEGAGGVARNTLVSDDFQMATRSALGTPNTLFRQYETNIGVSLPSGNFGLDVVADLMPRYDGPASGGSAGGLGPVRNNLTVQENQTIIFELTDGYFTQNTRFSFDITRFSVSPAPEPASWVLMIAGFGLIGTAMRRRPSASRRMA